LVHKEKLLTLAPELGPRSSETGKRGWGKDFLSGDYRFFFKGKEKAKGEKRKSQQKKRGKEKKKDKLHRREVKKKKFLR